VPRPTAVRGRGGGRRPQDTDRRVAAGQRDVPQADPVDLPVTTTARRRPGAAPAVVVVGLMLALGVLVTAALSGGAAEPSVLADPGPLTRWGVLVGRTAYDLAAIGTLGVLLVSVVLLPRSDGAFGPDAARLVRSVSWWSGAWSAAAALTAVLTLSKVAGLPAPSVLAPDVLPLILDLETTRALLASAWLAALVAIGARLTRSPATGLLLLLTAAGALVLPTLTGHARHGELAAITATSLALHVVAAAAWVGGRRAPAPLRHRPGSCSAPVQHARAGVLRRRRRLGAPDRLGVPDHAGPGVDDALRTSPARQGAGARGAGAVRAPPPVPHAAGRGAAAPTGVRPARGGRARRHGVRRGTGRRAVQHRAAARAGPPVDRRRGRGELRALTPPSPPPRHHHTAARPVPRPGGLRRSCPRSGRTTYVHPPLAAPGIDGAGTRMFTPC
jgi:hypothetical protein